MAAIVETAADYEAILHHVWSQLRDLADEAYAAGCGADDPARRAYASGVADLARYLLGYRSTPALQALMRAVELRHVCQGCGSGPGEECDPFCLSHEEEE